MFQSNKKFSNIKNIDSQANRSNYHKPVQSDAPPFSEKVNNPYVPFEEYNYMKIFEAGKLNCAFGLTPQNAFPVKQSWVSAPEREGGPEGAEWEGAELEEANSKLGQMHF